MTILPLNAALPDAESVAANALHIAERAAIPYKVNVESVIHRTIQGARRTHAACLPDAVVVPRSESDHLEDWDARRTAVGNA